MTNPSHTFASPFLQLQATPDESTVVAAMTSGREKTLVTSETNPVTGGNAILNAGGKNALSLMYADVIASRALVLSDAGQVLKCNSSSAVVLTIPNDSTVAWEGIDGVAAYQAGVGAVSFTAGSGVTLRGNPPTAAQYTTQGVMRVGTNEWAYL